jgi:uncharacterized protein YggT (Ycf19 family)
MGKVINFLFAIFYLLLALRALLPWFGWRRMNFWGRVLHKLTDPVLNPIRLGLPPTKIGMDVSPYVGIILLWILQRFLQHLWGI